MEQPSGALVFSAIPQSSDPLTRSPRNFFEQAGTRYEAWPAFQEQKYCRPKTENLSQFLPTLEHSVCNWTNQIACFDEPLKSDQSDCLFCTHFENFGWHTPCWAMPLIFLSGQVSLSHCVAGKHYDGSVSRMSLGAQPQATSSKLNGRAQKRERGGALVFRHWIGETRGKRRNSLTRLRNFW